MSDPEPTTKTAYGKGIFQQTQSQTRKPTYTISHTSVMAFLNRKGIHYLSEWPFLRPNEYARNGSPKTYVADILVHDPRFKNVIIEIEGRGSASRDNERRDAFFDDLGIPVLHYPNHSDPEAILTDLYQHYKQEEFP